MSFSKVNMQCFHVKARLAFHWCSYNNIKFTFYYLGITFLSFLKIIQTVIRQTVENIYTSNFI